MLAELLNVLDMVESSLSYFIAGVFIVAAFHKLSDIKRFKNILNDYQILPSIVVSLFALVLPLAELSVALILVWSAWFGLDGELGATASIILFLAYTGALLKVYLEGKSMEDCGCGGSANKPLSLWPILRNMVLIGLCVSVYFNSVSDGNSLGFSVIAICLAVALSFIYWTVEELHKNSHLILILEKYYD